MGAVVGSQGVATEGRTVSAMVTPRATLAKDATVARACHVSTQATLQLLMISAGDFLLENLSATDRWL